MSNHVEDQLPSLLLGDISPGAIRAILIHLRECPDCRDELVFIVIAHASLLCARPRERRSARRRSTQPTLYAAPGACPWPDQLAAVESGEIVDVHGFMANLGPGRWTLHPDGTATKIT